MPRKKVSAQDQGSESCLEGEAQKRQRRGSEKHVASPLGGGKEWSRCWRQTPHWELSLPAP